MAEYIERKRVLANTTFVHGQWDDTYISAEKIKEIPAADVVPVVHGKWIKGPSNPYCSECFVECRDETPFCPNCGAKMDGGADHAST